MGTTAASPPQGGGDEASHALRVTSVDIRVDAETLDRIFVVHSEEQPPVALRVSAIDLAEILANLSAAVTRSLN